MTRREPNSEATITLRTDDLLYAVANCAYITGDTMEQDDEHGRHMVFDLTQKGNIDRVRSMLDMAYARSVESLYPYCKSPVEDGLELGATEERDAYLYELSLPKGVSKSSLLLLRELLKEYMLDKVLADWLSITYPSAAENWQQKLSRTEDEIRAVMSLRAHPVKRRMSPF
jgi:hypothetical protein